MAHLFVENLTVIDCSALNSEHGLIGASWIVDIELGGDLDQQNMVFDFAHVKKTIKSVIDQEVDHKLLVPTQYANTSMVDDGKYVHLTFITEQAEAIKHRSPSDALCLIQSDVINIDSVESYLTKLLLKKMPDNVKQVTIKLREEQGQGSFYTYSHGLKKHDGNCQRIAHGHRSRIHIWLGQERAKDLEQKLATEWQHIYIGSQEDIVEQHDDSVCFAYVGDQGEFSLELPTTRTYNIPCDSTVECIAQYLADKLSAQHPSQTIKVQAFEGVGKGAIAYYHPNK